MKLYFACLKKEPSFGIPEISERQHDREQRFPHTLVIILLI